MYSGKKKKTDRLSFGINLARVIEPAVWFHVMSTPVRLLFVCAMLIGVMRNRYNTLTTQTDSRDIDHTKYHRVRASRCRV